MQKLQRDAHAIIKRSIHAVLPDTAVQKALEDLETKRPAHVIAIGKAAWKMASAASGILGNRLRSGVVITKYGHSEGSIPGIEIIEAGHPVPDENGVRAARRVLEAADGLSEDDLVVFLVSGGGSALFEMPLPGVTLGDIAEVTMRLLACGADIVELNTIRKHLSAVKGGRFAQRCAPARVLSIVLSDVLGDPLDSIASGPAYPDSTTSADALKILKRYGIKIPESVRDALLLETPKALDNVETRITGNVNALCHSAMAAARDLGYAPLLLTTTLDCEARDAGALLAAVARQVKSSGEPVKPPCAVILGGETVVHLKGKGRGGRNQELALSASRGIDGLKNTLIFSVGSDGTDGPTDAAGGMVTGAFCSECRRLGLSVDASLDDNDAYTLLEAAGGLIVTGPTGTNVNDLTVLLCGGEG